MKFFIKLSIWGYVIGGALFFLLSFIDINLPKHFIDPFAISFLSFVSAFLIILPRLIFNAKIKNNENRKHAMYRFQATIAFALILNGAGGLGLFQLYKVGFQYDKLVHFIVPMIFAVGWVEFFEDWFGFAFKESAFFAAALTFAGGFVWEFLEAFSDIFFGTQLLGGGGGRIFADTVLDLVMNILGLMVGLIWLYRRPHIAKARQPR